MHLADIHYMYIDVFRFHWILATLNILYMSPSLVLDVLFPELQHTQMQQAKDDDFIARHLHAQLKLIHATNNRCME